MRLFAVMCNQPQRLTEAVAPVRAALVAAPPVSRWGLGYVQGGEALLVRTPRSSSEPVDLFHPLTEIHTDCAIAQSVNDTRVSGTDNTPPFRFRRWMFAQTGVDLSSADVETVWPRLLEHVPDYMRRNLKGKMMAELTFHVLLAMLHDTGGVDDPNLPLATTRRAVGAALALISSELVKAGATGRLGNLVVSNGRSLVAARVDEPLWLRRLHVKGERTDRDESFRGVLLVSGHATSPGEGFEEVPAQQTVLVSRDLRVDLGTLEP
jgi:predicted glutamine amidotransferase